MQKTPQSSNGGSDLPDPLTRITGRHVGELPFGLELIKGKLKSGLKRIGFHFLALVAAGIIAEGSGYAAQAGLLYFGVICLLPRGFSPRRNSYIFPCATSLGQLALTLLTGYPLHLSVFMAGTQSWLQRAVIRRFRFGLDWVPAPFLLAFFVQSARNYDLPLAFFGLTAACGLGAYYAAKALDRRKLGKLEAEELARAESASPFKYFYLSVSQLEGKCAELPPALQVHAAAIVLNSRNILGCMALDPGDAQPGTRFLGRYLPASHKIVDEYIRLGREGRGHEDIESVLGRVDEIMERLAQAFQQEHGSLLRNDAMQLSAEMQVLDKLLKMDGR